MKNQRLLLRHPNEFFLEFLSPEARTVLAKVTSLSDKPYPEHNIFSIMRLDEFIKYIKLPITPGRSSVYEFCWLRKGTMERSNDSKQYTLTENCICFYAAGNIKSIESCSPDTEGYYCLFDKEFILHFLRDSNSLDELPFLQADGEPFFTLSQKSNEEVGRLLEKMDEEHQGDLPDKYRMIGTLLCQLLITIKRLSQEKNETRVHSAGELVTNTFLQHIKLHAQQRSVQYYADRQNVTANHLNKCVKTHTGRPVTAHIAEMVMLEAKVMLKQTHRTVAEIASSLGFDDKSYFTRSFRKNAGVSPKIYRTTHSEAA